MDIIIRNTRLTNLGDMQDVAIKDGLIREIGHNLMLGAAETLEAGGRVLIPAFVDGHIHLDKAYIAERMPNRSGTLAEAIEVTGKLKPTFTKEDIRSRAEKAIQAMIGYGSLHLRAQSEFDPAQGFTGFETILELKEKYRELVDIQVAAFPQEGIFKCPGTAEMMEEAMKMGADVVGGVPYNDRDAREHMDFVFELAKKYDKPVDFHQDFADDADHISMQYLCEKTVAEGFQGRVCAGHATALAALPPEELMPLAEKMSRAKISVMCLPATDLHLGGRKDSYNIRRTLAPVRTLKDAGVNICLATNNIRNPFTPYGNGDLVQIGMLAIPAAHLGGADDMPDVLSMLTYNPAKALHIDGYGVTAGCRANLVLLDTFRLTDAIIDIPQRLVIIKDGKIIIKKRVETERRF